MTIFVVGIILRVAFVWRPTDYRLLNGWRDADYTGIARSFYTEGMNILYPKVDWREDTAGVVEMEFPVIPWTAALLYHVVGYHEEVLRLLTALCSIFSLIVFVRLARRMLPPVGALVAAALFSVNGLLFALSGAMQPEPLQLLLIIAAASAIHRWAESGSDSSLLHASVFTAMAMLSKSSAGYIGLLLAYCVLRRLGMRAFRTPVVYVSAFLAIVPPALWYVWAHQHYLLTGLSLGVSNETHFLSWELIIHPWGWMRGNIIAEAINVFAVAGFPLAAMALSRPWKMIEFPLVWYLSAIVLYVLAADTSGDVWAYYYHCLSIPPACLLMGLGCLAIEKNAQWSQRSRRREKLGSVLAGSLLTLTIVGTLIWGGQRQYRTFLASGLEPLYRCSVRVRDLVPPDAKIVVRGATRLDEHGHRVAYNESMVFAWMNRKGFNYAQEDFSVSTFRSIAQRGGRYWLTDPDDRAVTDVYALLKQRCILVAHCDQFDLFDISPLGQAVELQPY